MMSSAADAAEHAMHSFQDLGIPAALDESSEPITGGRASIEPGVFREVPETVGAVGRPADQGRPVVGETESFDLGTA